jgi:hypothetical protein
VSPKTPTLPPNDAAMWRRLLARAHPDAGGAHELFIRTASVRDVVCGGRLQVVENPRRRGFSDLSLKKDT